MSDDNIDDPIKQIPIRDLKIDPTAEDLLDSPAMKPYMNLAIAVMGHKDTQLAIKQITALPLEQRYTWRIASALKWAFADFENLNIVADRGTLGQEDLDQLVDLLRIRPLQFCLFIAALFGEGQMEEIMSAAVKQVKAVRATRRKSLGRKPRLEKD